MDRSEMVRSIIAGDSCAGLPDSRIAEIEANLAPLSAIRLRRIDRFLREFSPYYPQLIDDLITMEHESFTDHFNHIELVCSSAHALRPRTGRSDASPISANEIAIAQEMIRQVPPTGTLTSNNRAASRVRALASTVVHTLQPTGAPLLNTGDISTVVGDGILAIWHNTPENAERIRATPTCMVARTQTVQKMLIVDPLESSDHPILMYPDDLIDKMADVRVNHGADIMRELVQAIRGEHRENIVRETVHFLPLMQQPNAETYKLAMRTVQSLDPVPVTENYASSKPEDYATVLALFQTCCTVIQHISVDDQMTHLEAPGEDRGSISHRGVFYVFDDEDFIPFIIDHRDQNKSINTLIISRGSMDLALLREYIGSASSALSEGSL